MIKAGRTGAISPRKGGATPNKPSTARANMPRPMPTANPPQTGNVLGGQKVPDPSGTPNKPKPTIPPPLPYMGG